MLQKTYLDFGTVYLLTKTYCAWVWICWCLTVCPTCITSLLNEGWGLLKRFVIYIKQMWTV